MSTGLDGVEKSLNITTPNDDTYVPDFGGQMRYISSSVLVFCATEVHLTVLKCLMVEIR
jgi:hypothetical protein